MGENEVQLWIALIAGIVAVVTTFITAFFAWRADRTSKEVQNEQSGNGHGTQTEMLEKILVLSERADDHDDALDAGRARMSGHTEDIEILKKGQIDMKVAQAEMNGKLDTLTEIAKRAS